MSVQSQIGRIKAAVAAAYAAAAEMEAELPSVQSVDNLADTVRAIPVGGLTFTNVTVSSGAFAANATYANYPYRAAIALSGATAEMTPDVVFDSGDATGGILSPVSASYDGGVYIYAVSPVSLTIPTIYLLR